MANTTYPYLPIEDYGMIGDLYTVALVSKQGSIDWCCLPDFDSPSVFGALLDAQKGGSFRLAPISPPSFSTRQLYAPDTNILITRFMTSKGIGEITDFMPVKHVGTDHQEHHLVRAVRMVYGSLTFRLECRPAFNYARDPHTLKVSDHGAVFSSKALALVLSSSVPLTDDHEGGVSATFTLSEGETVYFFLDSSQNKRILPHPAQSAQYDEQYTETQRYWRNWLSQCRYQGRWREYVYRSALALKLLTYAPTGAIVAAPTTSLPEGIGGERNWDYRFTWFRDAAFTLDSLMTLGFVEEADAFMGWLNERVKELEEGGSLQPMYTIHGGSEMPEMHLDHLEGYQRSQPVRIGNAAAKQLQLDIYGELMDVIYLYTHFHGISYEGWMKLCQQLEWLTDHWQEADEGIWEVRGGARDFLHSRLMSWVAFDRALRIAHEYGLPAPVEQWRQTSAQIYQEIMDKGWNNQKGCFVQYYGGEAVDASTLLLSLTGFVNARDPRMLATIECILQELTMFPHVYRYDIETAADDGLEGHEGTFNICSFWLVEALARANRVEEARLALEHMLTYANHVSLYAEETAITGEALGNFPQAFTHLALIHACLSVDEAIDNGFVHFYILERSNVQQKR
ncbi:glycoside hydrolase family 15 protein [Tengunoibacter tsumagoiensis]|uniref:Glucoamylase n=1 Tax=Tengunoibacter tsumagoiensis TaxID=2014871 RepID=A0A402A9F2_9CHLR|nr:glycoside hydrolase family 15 protein [Tengunoibacter tsumagoiensis]GCE15773.1 glucoamylase [Tengunoibacter tsumagoiensis]